MNDTTQQRVVRVRRRTLELERRRDYRRLTSITTACILLAVALYIAFKKVTYGSGSITMMTDLGGSVVLNQSGGGYVLVGLLAFAAGVAITSLCVYFRKAALMKRAGALHAPSVEDINNERNKPL